ncbi:hypothetical protein SK128_024645 [Halocaridina rubra]|uniref:4-coumarate--CoA ligase n=1 Tax=Halocaridina rubra TaxID=373956 RepID=A0AAN8WPK0_HALRR
MFLLWQRVGRTPRAEFRLPTRVLLGALGDGAISRSQAFHSIVRSEHEVDQPPGNLVSTVFQDAAKWGSRIALECCLSGRNCTYNQLLDGISKWSGFLTTLGLEKGDVIAIMMPNSPVFPIVMFGTISSGVVITPVNPRYTTEELVRQLNDSGAKLLVGDTSVEDIIMDSLRLYKKPLQVVMNRPSRIPGALNLNSILSDKTIPYMDTVEVGVKDTAMLPYSGGTTGPPKGVVISHGALAINLKMLEHDHFSFTKNATETTRQSFVTSLPFFHAFGVLAELLVGFANGTKLLTMPFFDPKIYIDSLSKNKVEMLQLVPPLLNFLINSPIATAEKLESVKAITIGAAPVHPSAKEALNEKLNKNILFQEVYGMTEVLASHYIPVNQETRSNLLPNVSVKILDTLSRELLPPTSKGEIYIKSPSTMTCYLNNEEATAETIDSEGWVRTGDVGYFDTDGYLKIVDRNKELIKVKGFQVSPSELEDLIRQHEQVLDVGVVGIPNDRFGEVPRAYVTTKTLISENDIHSFIDNRVAPHKKLTGGVVFIDEIPKTGTGKILRRELKKLALEA